MSARDRVEVAAAVAILSLPAAVKRRIAGPPVRREGLELDLDTQLLLKLSERDPEPPLRTLTAQQAREQLIRSAGRVQGTVPRLAEVRELAIAGAAGPLQARLYTPEEASAAGPAAGLVVYFHGGGWVCGDLDTHDQPCRLLAASAGTRVLSVAYRLAPEHPFPAPVEDARAAFRDAVARAGELGVDPARVAVAGDSAGGHLAAVTAQLAAADGGPAPAFQLLIYPVTDCAGVAPSRRSFAEGFVLTKEDMDWYEASFIGEHDRRDPRISPLLAESLAGVAPALLVTAGFDPLRDEGEAYARRLREHGVAVALRRHPGFVHGFTHILLAGHGARVALGEMGGAVRTALAGAPRRAEMPAPA
ncbi:MAG: alpha/beta hydrolase [Solirubrobacteraceae bacterium]